MYRKLDRRRSQDEFKLKVYTFLLFIYQIWNILHHAQLATVVDTTDAAQPMAFRRLKVRRFKKYAEMSLEPKLWKEAKWFSATIPVIVVQTDKLQACHRAKVSFLRVNLWLSVKSFEVSNLTRFLFRLFGADYHSNPKFPSLSDHLVQHRLSG